MNAAQVGDLKLLYRLDTVSQRLTAHLRSKTDLKVNTLDQQGSSKNKVQSPELNLSYDRTS